jgi:hypothetical protein
MMRRTLSFAVKAFVVAAPAFFLAEWLWSYRDWNRWEKRARQIEEIGQRHARMMADAIEMAEKMGRPRELGAFWQDEAEKYARMSKTVH